ncbi:hypothetical protein BZM27_46665 [Paraburkholderia steynii]|uniref:Uncharacterized protein n=1 Tax=Paraburkholderia steynii TaxID=1245441 RepID=A0A4R0X5G9_9BURK|nr:hypothetical protein BZM27_46665 [Paraburkholderia steynii]
MFLTCEQNRLSVAAGLTGGAALWAVAEMCGGGDVLILQIAATKREYPRVAMVELASSAAATLTQLDLAGQIVRGAAVLSAGPLKDSAQWKLEPLSEIHLGATEAFDEEHSLVSFARLTTASGEQFSLPIGIAARHSRGKRIYPAGPARSRGTGRRKPAANSAGAA